MLAIPLNISCNIIFSANNIEFWDNVPNEDPIDFFDAYHISLGYGFGKNFSNKLNIGIKNTVIYNQLYIDESYGYNIDLGVSYLYSKLLSIGISINQLGFEKYNGLFTQYPLLAGVGATINLYSLKTKLNTDFIYNHSLSGEDAEIYSKFSTITQFPYIALITGYHYSDSKNEFSCGFSFKYRKKKNWISFPRLCFVSSFNCGTKFKICN